MHKDFWGGGSWEGRMEKARKYPHFNSATPYEERHCRKEGQANIRTWNFKRKA